MTSNFRASMFAIGMISAIASVAPAQSGEINFVSWGGDWQGAQTKAISDPWSKETGNKVVNLSYNGDVGPIKAMVAAGNYEWDIVDVEHSVTNILCEEGLVETLPDSFWEEAGGKDKFDPMAVHPCGAGNVLGATVLAYDAKKVDPAKAPKNWADFWDVQNFPGPRALRRTPRGNLEFALLADGVPISEIYTVLNTEEGIERAFSKLDEIKPHIVKWWSAGAEPPQLLADGEVLYTSAFNGRIAAANKAESRDFRIVWNGQYTAVQHYVIPKGSPRKDLALSWIKYSLSDKAQADIANLIPYGPVNADAVGMVAPETKLMLPSAPENGFPQDAVAADENFWGANQEPLTERFEAWLVK